MNDHSTTQLSHSSSSTLSTATASSSPEIDVAALVTTMHRTRRRRRLIIAFWQVLIFVLFFGGWELASGDPDRELVLIDEYFVSQPSAIWQALQIWGSDGTLWSNSLITLQAVVLGFIIGAVLGCSAGLVIGASSTIAAIFQPFVTALYSVPRLALVPLFLVWFGFGLSSRLAFITVVVFFLVFMNTVNGARDVDEELLSVVRVMGGKRRHLFTKVIFPSALTWIGAGLRISVPYALVAAVTAEMLASNLGLGALLIRSSQQFYMSGVFASIIAMVGISLVLTGIVVLIERRVLRWKPSGHASGI